MNYATWNLRNIGDGYLDGPESSILAIGGTVEAIWANGQVENGATILGKVSGDLANLSEWNLVEVSRGQAESFIEQNFVPYVEVDGKEVTLQDAIKILD